MSGEPWILEETCTSESIFPKNFVLEKFPQYLTLHGIRFNLESLKLQDTYAQNCIRDALRQSLIFLFSHVCAWLSISDINLVEYIIADHAKIPVKMPIRYVYLKVQSRNAFIIDSKLVSLVSLAVRCKEKKSNHKQISPILLRIRDVLSDRLPIKW